MVFPLRCATPVDQRVKGERYPLFDLPDGETRKWSGSQWLCKHDRLTRQCKECRSDDLCEHGLLRCTPCGTSERSSELECANDSCTTSVARRSPYFPLCAHCFRAAQPDVAGFGWKEKLLHDAITAAFPAEPFRWDRRIPGDASLYRPDFAFLRSTHVAIVENDENGDAGHPDQWSRREAIQAVYGRPVFFIHFNPDDYTHDDMRVAGCFPRPGEVNQAEWKRRVAVCFELLRGALDHVPPQPLTVFKLFFDDAGVIVGRWDGQWPLQYSAIA